MVETAEKPQQAQPTTESEDKAKATPAPKETKRAHKRSKPSSGSKKRSPARPHRKLPQDVLDGRIGKLKKRIEKARGQLEDAERHIDAYMKESSYRESDEAEKKE